MSKPIVLTEEHIASMVADFRKQLQDAKMSDGKISYTKNFEYRGEDDVKISVMFTPSAYVKMLTLLDHFDSEVAWHGTVERRSDELFIITDIIVYPQTVTGATVTTDQEEYQKWLMNLDDDYANSMHMQGHSHVRMGTSPSSVDENHQREILEMLNGESFYIFMIWNKKLEHNIKVYDYATNTMYESKDINVSIFGDNFDTESFIADSDAVVKTKTYATGSNGYAGGYASGHGAQAGAKKADSEKDAKDAKEPKKRGRPPKEKTSELPAPSLVGPYTGYRGCESVRDYDAYLFGDHRFDT